MMTNFCGIICYPSHRAEASRRKPASISSALAKVPYFSAFFAAAFSKKCSESGFCVAKVSKKCREGGDNGVVGVNIMEQNLVIGEIANDFQRLLEIVTLEHIFSPEELSEMSPVEKRLLRTYLKTRNFADWLVFPKSLKKKPKKRKALIEALQSERLAIWTRKIDQFLHMCVFETLRRVYYNALLQLAKNLVQNPRSLKRVEVEAVKLLKEMLAEHDQMVDEFIQRLTETSELQQALNLPNTTISEPETSL